MDNLKLITRKAKARGTIEAEVSRIAQEQGIEEPKKVNVRDAQLQELNLLENLAEFLQKVKAEKVDILAELEQVAGIGPATLEKVREHYENNQ